MPITIIEGGSTSDETIKNICNDYLNNVPVSEIKKQYNIQNWSNILKRIYRTTGFKRKAGRPKKEISSEYVSKKGTRYNITKNNTDYGNYSKKEIFQVLKILDKINWDYDEWRNIKKKNIPEKYLKLFIKEQIKLNNNNLLTTSKITELINKKYNKYYSVEYTRTILHKWSKKEEWLICNIDNEKKSNKGIELKWSIV